MGKMKLSKMEESFCMYYCVLGKVKDAYKLSGYSQNSINTHAYVVFHRQRVQDRIAEIKLSRKSMLSFSMMEAELFSLYRECKERDEMGIAFKCLKEINVMNGYKDGIRDVEEVEEAPSTLIEGMSWEDMHKAISVSTAEDNKEFEKMLLGEKYIEEVQEIEEIENE